MRITIAVPEAHREDANHLAMVLGYTPADAGTYRAPDWRDADGNLYAVASTLTFGAFVQNATSGLQRPVWDVEPYQVDMAAASRAQALLAFWVPSEASATPPLARTDAITAIGGMEGLDAVAAMGLTPVEGDAP